MAPRVMVIGLDAAEATLIERWSTEGALPAFAELASRGTSARLANSLETLPGAIWPEISSGRSCGRVPLYFHPVQLHTGEARLRPIAADEVDPGDYFWSIASDAGNHVAIVDIPQTVLKPDLNGIHVTEWGLHDRNFEIASSPASLIAEIRSRHGDHPIDSCDDHGETVEGYEALLDGLLDGVRRKTELLIEILTSDRYDLFACAYGETHCVGHQFWHFHDPDDPRHDPAAPKRLEGAIRGVYCEIDRGVGRLIDACGPDTTVMVLASHGMGPYRGGPQMLREILVRLGMSSAPDTRTRRTLRRIHNMARRLPRGLKPQLQSVRELRGFRRAQEAVGASLEPLESSMTRAAALYNNRCGAIRINLRGREPHGCVDPGPEADALVEEIRSELLRLEDPDNGEAIIKRVITAQEAFGPDHHPDVPDLMVVFRDDMGRIDACRSSRIGTLRMPVYTNRMPRFGDHTAESRLWMTGPEIAPGSELSGANVLDIAPTVLDLLGVPIPNSVDGRPISLVRA